MSRRRSKKDESEEEDTSEDEEEEDEEEEEGSEPDEDEFLQDDETAVDSDDEVDIDQLADVNQPDVKIIPQNLQDGRKKQNIIDRSKVIAQYGTARVSSVNIRREDRVSTQITLSNTQSAINQLKLPRIFEITSSFLCTWIAAKVQEKAQKPAGISIDNK